MKLKFDRKSPSKSRSKSPSKCTSNTTQKTPSKCLASCIWGFAVEHEYALRIPVSHSYPGGIGPDVISSPTGKYGEIKRQTFWVPDLLPRFIYEFATENGKVETQMKIDLDWNGIDVLELITKNPVSRTVGDLVCELGSTLKTVESTVYSKEFRDFVRRRVKKMKANAKSQNARSRPRVVERLNVFLSAVEYLYDSTHEPNYKNPIRDLFSKNNFKQKKPSTPLLSLRFPYGSDVIFNDYWEGQKEMFPIYTGSIHVNVTLPHAPDESVTSNSEFMKRHVRAAAALQWIEPLLLVVLGSPDPFHSIDETLFPALSFRHTTESSVGFVTNNVVEKGFSKYRMASEDEFKPYPEGNKTVDNTSLFYSERLSDMKGDESGPLWMRSMKQNKASEANVFVFKSYDCPCRPFSGTDFRRDTENRTGLFGFEFRSLDIIPVENLACVLRLIWYIFDASNSLPKRNKVLSSPEYNAFNSNSFAKFMISASRIGSRATITKEYAEAITRVFRLDANVLIGSETAFDAINKLSGALFERFGGGKGIYSHLVDFDDDGNRYIRAPYIPDISSAAVEYHETSNTKTIKNRKLA